MAPPAGVERIVTELGEVHVLVDGGHRVYEGVPSGDEVTLSIRHSEEGPVTVMSGHEDWWWEVDPAALPDWARQQAEVHADRVRRP